MSYILDALNKSEAERTRGARPSLGMVHQPASRSRIGLWLVAAALLANACIGVVWLTLRDSPARSAGAAVDSPPQPIATHATPAPSSRPVPDSDVRPRVAPRVATPSVAVAEPAMDLSSITFSTHVYSDDPAMRAVTMHGKRFVEGDMIADGVRLARITETGVVLEANGRQIPIEVLQDWR